MFTSRGGAWGLKRFICFKYYIVVKWKNINIILIFIFFINIFGYTADIDIDIITPLQFLVV